MLPDRIPAQRNEDGRAAAFPSLTLPVASGRPREQPLALKHTRRHAQVTDLREGVIRVHAPLQAKVSMAIQLNGEMKARDIMARFDIENGRGSRSASRRQRQFLFEVGGNIGERCLDPDAHLMDVYRANPHCEWVLKSRLT